MLNFYFVLIPSIINQCFEIIFLTPDCDLGAWRRLTNVLKSHLSSYPQFQLTAPCSHPSTCPININWKNKVKKTKKLPAESVMYWEEGVRAKSRPWGEGWSYKPGPCVWWRQRPLHTPCSWFWGPSSPLQTLLFCSQHLNSGSALKTGKWEVVREHPCISGQSPKTLSSQGQSLACRWALAHGPYAENKSAGSKMSYWLKIKVKVVLMLCFPESSA